MPQNIFKIYNGRTFFLQWEKNQKLIVLDDSINEVHFSNRDMLHSIEREVYIDADGLRLCNVPDDLLKLPKNLTARVDGERVKIVKFAVMKRPIPIDYVSDANEEIYKIQHELGVLEENMREMDEAIDNIVEKYSFFIDFDFFKLSLCACIINISKC